MNCRAKTNTKLNELNKINHVLKVSNTNVVEVISSLLFFHKEQCIR